jgi:hypothetical protein
MLTTVSLLQEAQRLLREKGRTRHTWVDDKGRLCLLAALHTAAFGDGIGIINTPSENFNKKQNVFSEGLLHICTVAGLPRGRHGIVNWNDKWYVPTWWVLRKLKQAEQLAKKGTNEHCSACNG